MPKFTCPNCGVTISYSKLDNPQKLHKCLKKFRDRIVTKPVFEVEEKDASETEILNTESTKRGYGKGKSVSEKNEFSD